MADGHDWSDRSGRYKRTKENTQLPSGQWIWVSCKTCLPSYFPQQLAEYVIATN